MKNEIIIYGQDPRVGFDYCHWNTEKQVMQEFIVELKSLANELDKENRNRDVLVLDTISERNGTKMTDMTEEDCAKMKKQIIDSIREKTPTYTHGEVENAIRGMIINMLDHMEKSNNTLQKP